MATYEAMRHHATYDISTIDVGEAVLLAWSDLETGEAWPSRIIDDAGETVWQESGPFKTTQSLMKFAEDRAILLPAYE